MIYTVTFNPAVDCAVRVGELLGGGVNKAIDENILAGGKGINVSCVLNNLGIKNTALGFLAGSTGKAVKHELDEQGVDNRFIFLPSGNSRINLKIISEADGFCETEINAPGPDIDKASLDKLYQQLETLENGDKLVLAGSIPRSLPDSAYADITAMLDNRGIDIIADASGKLLEGVLKYRPFLIKPNHIELGELFGETVDGFDKALELAFKLKDMGARNVLVSMGGDGAVFAGENGEKFTCAAPKGKAVNTVGAGDSMVAGFIAGLIKFNDPYKAFLYGISAGSASAFSQKLASADEVEKIYGEISQNR